MLLAVAAGLFLVLSALARCGRDRLARLIR